MLLSDQPTENMGNLWVWPGMHLTHQAFFREHGPDALLGCGGCPPIALPTPEQVRGRAGHLLLAHYLMGHNIGGNTSDTVRRAVYFRVKRVGHALRWRPLLMPSPRTAASICYPTLRTSPRFAAVGDVPRCRCIPGWDNLVADAGQA